MSPAIITSGPYQNVNSAPANDEGILYKGTASTGYKQNLVFHRDAFQLVTVPLIVDPSMQFAARADDADSGLYRSASRRGTDITNDEIVTR